jgi:hypothetical protein
VREKGEERGERSESSDKRVYWSVKTTTKFPHFLNQRMRFF